MSSAQHGEPRPEPVALDWAEPTIEILVKHEHYQLRRHTPDPAIVGVAEWYELDLYATANPHQMSAAVGLLPAGLARAGSEIIDTDTGPMITMFFEHA